MTKLIVFGDAHKATKMQYKALLDETINKGIKSIYFLGDIVGQDNYFQYSEFVRYAGLVGIPVYSIIGNHDQAAVDYVQGLPSWGKENMDLRLKQTPKFLNMIRNNFNDKLTLDDILLTHALPKGRKLSGPNGNKIALNDHRLKYPTLWNYSFNTFDDFGNKMPEVGVGLNKFDPEVMKWNFDYLTQRGLKFMIKGHEHTNKIWYSPNFAIMVDAGYNETLSKQAIIQVGQFEQGNYLIIDSEKNKVTVEYKRL